MQALEVLAEHAEHFMDLSTPQKAILALDLPGDEFVQYFAIINVVCSSQPWDQENPAVFALHASTSNSCDPPVPFKWFYRISTYHFRHW